MSWLALTFFVQWLKAKVIRIIAFDVYSFAFWCDQRMEPAYQKKNGARVKGSFIDILKVHLEVGVDI